MTPHFIQPYLFFGGRCEEAIEFYRTALGAEVDLMMRFQDGPQASTTLPPGHEKKIMHVSFRIGNSVLMASDGCGEDNTFNGFKLSLSVADETAARAAFGALAQSGTVDMPLDKTFWSPLFGIVTDRFGLGWMITVPHG